MDGYDFSFFDTVWWMNVRLLPVRWRRLFVMLIPITGPLWVMALLAQIGVAIALLPVALVCLMIAVPVVWCLELWQE